LTQALLLNTITRFDQENANLNFASCSDSIPLPIQESVPVSSLHRHLQYRVFSLNPKIVTSRPVTRSENIKHAATLHGDQDSRDLPSCFATEALPPQNANTEIGQITVASHGDQGSVYSSSGPAETSDKCNSHFVRRQDQSYASKFADLIEEENNREIEF
jgi:hypothetical protein